MSSIRINVGEASIGRSDLISVPPEAVLADDQDNSRVDPHTAEEIEALAESLHEFGQQQPVVVRRVEENRIRLVMGFGRRKAMLLHNEKYPDNPLVLQCRVVHCNAEEAYARNITENIQRANMSPRDCAHAQRVLREQHQWTDDRIANLFKHSVSYIRNLQKTLQLSTPIQQEMSNGNMGVGTALDLVQLPEPVRPEVVEEARDPATGHIDGTKVRQRLRTQKQANGDGASRRITEVRKFFESLGEVEKIVENEDAKELTKSFNGYLAGKITDKQMENAILRACN